MKRVLWTCCILLLILAVHVDLSAQGPVIHSISATPPGLSQVQTPFAGRTFTLTINGANFSPSSHANLAGNSLVTTYVNPAQLIATVPTSALMTLGSFPITVVNTPSNVSNEATLRIIERGDANGNRSVNIGDALFIALTVGGLTTPPLPLSAGDLNLSGEVNIGDALVAALFSGRINSNLPALTIASVSAGTVSRGATVTVTGSGFSPTPGNNQVLFATSDGVTRVTPDTASPTTLSVTVPGNAISGAIQVFNLVSVIGSSEFPLAITGTSLPLMLTSVTPFENIIPGSSIQLRGSGFAATPADNIVLFRTSSGGTTTGTVTAATSASLTVTVPANAACGDVTVTTEGQTSPAKSLLVQGTSCSLHLSRLLSGSFPGDEVILEGTGFDVVTPAVNIVRFPNPDGTSIAPVVQAGATQLQLFVPPDAITGAVTVSVGTTTSNTVPYTQPAGFPFQVSKNSGDAQVGQVSNPLELPLVAKVTSEANVPVAGFPVSWSVTSGGGSVSSPQTFTGSNGEARVMATLGASVGTHAFSATTPGLLNSPITFTANAYPPFTGNLELLSGTVRVRFGNDLHEVISETVRVLNGNVNGSQPQSTLSGTVRVSRYADGLEAFGTGPITAFSDMVRINRAGLVDHATISETVRVNMAGLTTLETISNIGRIHACFAPVGFSTNLIPNGDFETDLADLDNTSTVSPSCWASSTLRVARYGTNGFPALNTVAGGGFMFAFGGQNATATATQTIDVSTLTSTIDGVGALVNLSARLGGNGSQEDNAKVTAAFLDGSNQPLGTPVQIGPVTAANRSNATILLPVSSGSISVPAGTRKILITVTPTQTTGPDNDGYVDNVSLVLSPNGF